MYSRLYRLSQHQYVLFMGRCTLTIINKHENILGHRKPYIEKGLTMSLPKENGLKEKQ